MIIFLIKKLIAIFKDINKNKKKKRILCKSFLKGIKPSRKRFFLFSNTKNIEYKIYSQILNNFVLFEDFDFLLKNERALKNVGLDPTKQIFKIELYKKEYFEYKNILKILNKIDKDFYNLKILNNGFQILFFYDLNFNIEILLKEYNKYDFKNLIIKFFDKNFVQYSLLSAINNFNINTGLKSIYYLKNKSIRFNNKVISKALKYEKNKKAEIKQKEILKGTKVQKDKLNNFKKIYTINSTENILQKAISEGEIFYFINIENKIYDFKFDGINDYKSCYTCNGKNFEASICEVFDLQKNLIILKLKVQNYSLEKLTGIFLIGIKSQQKTINNSVYCLKGIQNEIVFFDYNSKKYFCFDKDFDQIYLTKQGLNLASKFEVLPFNNLIRYEKILKDNYKENQNLLCISNQKLAKNKQYLFEAFQNNKNQFIHLNLPKVMSKNKVLNYLINSFLPKKIFENVVLNKSILDEYQNLINLDFISKFINKEFLHNNLNTYFLIKNNIFQTYFNLFYFYFGVWFDKKGLHINHDKESVIKDSIVSFKLDEKTIFLKISKNNLKNNIKEEIIFNNVKYTNLKYISFDKKDLSKKLNLQF